MKKRTLILAMTALMITMTSAGNCTAVYAEETAAATEDAGSTESGGRESIYGRQ